MNQYDTLIRDYFYEHKSFSLEKIGLLTLDERSVSPEHPPAPESMHFKFDKKADTSPGLITYIAESTKKNRVLINSDMESYVELMRQFMNIGKPYEMEGVGIFKMVQSGAYGFDPYDYSIKKDDSKPNRKQQNYTNTSLSVKKASNKNILMLFALVIVLGVLGTVGWGTYKLFIENKNAPATIVTTDSTLQNPIASAPLTDTSVVKNADSSIITDTVTTVVASGDSAYYKFVHEITYSSIRAYKRTNELRSWGNPADVDSIKRDTTTTYQLYFRMKLKAADTTRIKDSLSKFLQKKIRIKPETDLYSDSRTKLVYMKFLIF